MRLTLVAPLILAAASCKTGGQTSKVADTGSGSGSTAITMADMIIDSCSSYVSSSGSTITLKMDRNCQPRIRTKKFYSAGKVSATLKLTGPHGAVSPSDATGVVAAFYLTSGEPQTSVHHQTEVDCEFLGKEPTLLHWNYWIDGVSKENGTPKLPGGKSLSDGASFTMEWDANKVGWFMDSTNALGDGTYRYRDSSKDQPFKAQAIYFSLWDGSGTNGWAGTMNWSASPTYTFTISDLKIEGGVEASDPG